MSGQRARRNELIPHDDYARERALRDSEFAEAIRSRAMGLLDGSGEDKRIAYRVLIRQLGLTRQEVYELERQRAGD